jgi:long-chain fatty acid transport protein
MNCRVYHIVVLALVGLAAGNAWASGFQLADQDAAATARGEAFVATADNASAIYYNPAGITQLSSNNVRSGIYGIYLKPTFRPPVDQANSGQTYQISKNFAAVPQFFATHTLKSLPLSFGVGVYAPYGGSITWPDDTGFRAVATKGSLTYLRVNPVVAYQVLPSLSIGAGVMVDYAHIDLEQGLRSIATPVNFFQFSGQGFSVGYNAGIRWQPLEQLSFGATFRSSNPIYFGGQTDFERIPIIPAGGRNAHMNLTFPLTAAVGVSYRPTPKWNLELDADYTDWNSFNKTSIQQQTPVPHPFDPTGKVPVTLDWQGSWMYEFGVTRYFDNGWRVSAGYVFSQNSVPNAYYTPLAAHLDRHFFSVGTGYQGGRYSLDVAYQVGYGPPHTVTGSAPSSTPAQYAGQTANGTYAFFSQAVLLTVGLRF